MKINFLKVQSNTLSLTFLKNVPKRLYATKTKDIVTELEVEEVPKYDAEARYDEKEIERIQNISGLAPQHQNIMHGKKPYENSIEWYHDTVWYRKRILGKYGLEAAGYNPGICWPTKEQIEDWNEYEKLEYPDSMKSLWKKFEQNKIEEKEAIRKR